MRVIVLATGGCGGGVCTVPLSDPNLHGSPCGGESAEWGPPAAQTGWLGRLRAMPLADVSILMAIVLIVNLVPALIVQTAIRAQGGGHMEGMAAGLATWLAPLALYIWRAVPADRSGRPNTDLRVFHMLPVVLMSFLIVHGEDAAFIRTLLGFVDLVLLLALLVYGLLCLRLLVRPPLIYLVYLAGMAVSCGFSLSRI